MSEQDVQTVETAPAHPLLQLGEKIRLSSNGAVTAVESHKGELTLLAHADAIAELLTLLRDAEDCRFTILIDICGADYPSRPERFEVVYHLLSITKNLRIRVKIPAREDHPVPSVVGVFPAAGWFEREAWDLYGIFFAGNPDLRRILTDYGFDGHPLRKDFPMTGYVELRYDEEQKRVVYEPVKLQQEFRNFDFMSPWEGANYVLPGDEKAPSTFQKEAAK